MKLVPLCAAVGLIATVLTTIYTIIAFSIPPIGSHTIQCGDYSSTATARFLTPVRRAVSAFHHIAFPHSDDYNHGAVEISTWPTYGVVNEKYQMSAEISGYAYTLPDTHHRELQRTKDWIFFGYLYALHKAPIIPAWQRGMQNDSWQGLNVYKFVNTTISDKLLSYSVTGAEVLSTAPRLLDESKTITNEYGHFTLPLIDTNPFKMWYNKSTRYFESYLNLACPKSPSRAAPRAVASILPFPAKGLTIVSDIDDVIRNCKLWDMAAALDNVFRGSFTPVQNMVDFYANLTATLPDTTRFSYVTDAPELLSDYYVNGTLAHYPVGSFHFRPTKFDSFSEMFEPRFHAIKRQIEAFPHRKFVLVGDTTTPSLLRSYTKLVKAFPDQVLCILVRDVGASEKASHWITPDLDSVKEVNQTVQFFNASDVSELDEMTKVMRAISDGGQGSCKWNRKLPWTAWDRFTAPPLSLIKGLAYKAKCSEHTSCPFEG